MKLFSFCICVLGLLAVCFSYNVTQWLDRGKAKVLKPDSPVAAAMQRYQARLSEDGRIPDNAVVKAKQFLDGMPHQVRQYSAGVSPASWTWLGPGNVGGRIRAILIDPTNPNVIYIGSASGGIWKTTNGGTSWFPLDDFMATLAIGSMAMDPTNPSVLYAGTGEGFFETQEGTLNTAAVRGAGIFKSTDAGATWNQIPSTATADWYFVNRLVISPTNSQILLAGTSTGVYRSTNGGATWTKTLNEFVYDVDFHPTDGNKAVLGTHDTGVYYSNDGGVSWTHSISIAGHRTELAYSRSTPTTVYATVSEGDRIKIWRSQNGGQTFTLRTTGNGISTYSAYNNALFVHPTTVTEVYLGGVDMYRSTNSGSSQGNVFPNVHSDIHIIVAHPGFNGTSNRTVFVGCDGGIYRIPDITVNTSQELNNNLGITQFYGGAVNPTSGVVVGGTQDNFTQRYTGSTEGWTAWFGGDGGHCAADPTNPNYFYGCVYWALIFRSTNGASSGNYIYNGITDADDPANVNFIPYFMLDPNNENRMLAGTKRLWRSNNVKAATPTWSIIKPSIEPSGLRIPDAHFAANSPYNISTLAVAAGNPDIVWVGHNNGKLYKSTNGTAVTPTWTEVGASLPSRWVSSICIDPNNPNRVYVALMGWEANNIWRTTDGGQSWVDLSTGKLPPAPMSAITIHRTQPGWLYVGSDLGMFTSVDDGQTWTVDTQGPGTVPVELFLWKNNQTLIAVTHGRGMFQATINAPEDVVSPQSFAIWSGVRESGRLQELFRIDGAKMVIKQVFGGARAVPLTLEVAGTLPYSTLSELKIEVTSSVSVPASNEQFLLFNYLTQSWEKVYAGGIGTADNSKRVTVEGAPSRFVGPNREIRMQLAYKKGVTSDFFYTASVDQVLWKVKQ